MAIQNRIRGHDAGMGRKAMPKTVEERLRIIEIKDAAAHVMYRYWRCLDYKLFDELPDVFAEDAYGDWGMPTWRKTGRAEICEWLHANESQPDLRLSHFGHNPEIFVIDDKEAHGIFKLQDLVMVGGMKIMAGFGQYRMVFVECDDGAWRIKKLNLNYAYRESMQHFVDDTMLMTTPELSGNS
jgi:SnoaL-like domain